MPIKATNHQITLTLKKIIFFTPIFVVVVSINFVGIPIMKLNMCGFNKKNIKKIKPDVIVLGCSRGQEINHNSVVFYNHSFHNSAFGGCVFKSIIRIYKLYKQNNLLPKTIILEISPSMFNLNREDMLHKSFRVTDFMEFLSPKYVQLCIAYVTDIKFAVDNYPEKKTPFDWQNLDWAEDRDSFHDFDTVDMPYFEGQFPSFIRELLSDNIRVILFLAPYHMRMFKKLASSTQYFLFMKRIQQIVLEYKLELVGSYDPEACETMNDDDFSDPRHPTTATIKKLFTYVLF